MWHIRLAAPGAVGAGYDPARVRVRVRIVRLTRTRMDPDNLVASAKHVLDAMRTLGVIVDDAHVELRVRWMKYRRPGRVILHVHVYPEGSDAGG